jgi:hypothetical protein
MAPEKIERLRQYLAGRSEISAGEQLVLRGLRDKARERQRLMLGLPLVLLGVGGFYLLSRRPPEALLQTNATSGHGSAAAGDE